MLPTTEFLGLECVVLQNQALSLLISRSTGPRVLALHLGEGPNLFAELPHFTIPCPGIGELTLWGGHRLWHAPEVGKRTYLPDDKPVQIDKIPGGLVATPPIEMRAQIQKSLRVTLPNDDATVVVDHVLVNEGLWPITCAPWAITQLKPGGTAVLPQPTSPIDPDGLQPNRPLALWPYTDMKSPHIQWGNEYIFVYSKMTEGALKVGFPNRRGWLAYHWQNTLFVKWAQFDEGATYLDFGSSSQCYCNDQFLELETLGPEATIQPGKSIRHREVWRIYAGVELAPEETAVGTLVNDLNLDSPPPELGIDGT